MGRSDQTRLEWERDALLNENRQLVKTVDHLKEELELIQFRFAKLATPEDRVSTAPFSADKNERGVQDLLSENLSLGLKLKKSESEIDNLRREMHELDHDKELLSNELICTVNELEEWQRLEAQREEERKNKALDMEREYAVKYITEIEMWKSKYLNLVQGQEPKPEIDIRREIRSSVNLVYEQQNDLLKQLDQLQQENTVFQSKNFELAKTLEVTLDALNSNEVSRFLLEENRRLKEENEVLKIRGAARKSYNVEGSLVVRGRS
jgi:hypothetical protein